ncbi:unnamed protein product [Trichobilharzia regenti]|nr:unnamed protein product [Trichobilharzia regenti]
MRIECVSQPYLSIYLSTCSCVSSEDGSVALGLQIFFVRTLAYIPAPIYFGQLFDLACQYRLDSVNQQYSSTASPSPSPSVLFSDQPSSFIHQNESISPSSSSSSSLLLLQNSLYSSTQSAAAASHQLMTSGTGDGGCLEYNLEGLPFIWLGTVCALKVVSLIGSTITWRLAK